MHFLRSLLERLRFAVAYVSTGDSSGTGETISHGQGSGYIGQQATIAELSSPMYIGTAIGAPTTVVSGVRDGNMPTPALRRWQGWSLAAWSVLLLELLQPWLC